MIKVDWFQSFQNVQHSVGVIYLIVNLPREVRFWQGNVIVVGVIPGPSEPSLNINTFLALLLICASCDLPATRNFGGFVSYKFTHGMMNELQNSKLLWYNLS